jgi:hypothetical protein
VFTPTMPIRSLRPRARAYIARVEIGGEPEPLSFAIATPSFGLEAE